MSVYTKDEINFHGFLKVIREMQKKSLSALGRGLYCRSMMDRIEKGERLPKKLERDRIVARLGVSGEGYEDYLSREEYDEWLLRQEILGGIKEKDLEKVEELLERFAKQPKLGKVEKQFLEAMRFMYLKLKGASAEEMRQVIELAVSYTIPDVKKGFPKKLLLSDQEINLLIEYVDMYYYSDVVSEQLEWKLQRYADVEMYIQQSCIDDIGKTKVYPKLVYYMYKEAVRHNIQLEMLYHYLEMCNSAIELLRDENKLYYFVELLEMRQCLVDKIMEIDTDILQEKKEQLKALALVSKEWADMFVKLYYANGISPYMEEFTCLYNETESYNTNEVVRRRRKMCGYTQKELAENVCSARTVIRAEQDEISLQRYDLTGLFEKLGLCPEYVRAKVISYNPRALVLRSEIAKYNNKRVVHKWKSALDELEAILNMEIVQNEQAICRNRVLLEHYSKEITNQEAIERLKEVLELTVSLEGILKTNQWYLTREEISCLHNIAVRTESNGKNIYLDILKEYFDQAIENGHLSARLEMLDLIVTGIANYLGSEGKYEESSWYGEFMIKEGLKNRRMRTLARNLYSNCWNKYNINGGDFLARDNQEVDETLHTCILIAEINKNKKLKDFMVEKLEN